MQPALQQLCVLYLPTLSVHVQPALDQLSVTLSGHREVLLAKRRQLLSVGEAPVGLVQATGGGVSSCPGGGVASCPGRGVASQSNGGTDGHKRYR